MVILRTLGSLDVRDADGRVVSSILAQPQLMALLVYLAEARPGTFHRRDTLIGLMWPEAPTHQARHGLNQKLYALRQALGEKLPESRGRDEVGFPEGSLSFDVRDFREAIHESRWEDALELYDGPFLDGFYVSHAPGLERWIEERRGTLRRIAAGAASTLFEQHQTGGDLASAARWARRALEIEPDNELLLRRLLAILLARGDRTEAVGLFTHFRERLGKEYGLEPSAETLALVEDLLPPPELRPVVDVPSAPFPPSSPTPHRAPDSERAHEAESYARKTPATSLGATLAGAGAALLGLAAVLWVLQPSQGAVSAVDDRGGARVVAVVPIASTGSVPPEFGDIARALTSELTALLGQVPGLMTIPAEVIQPYVLDGTSATEMGRALRADAIVEASLDWGAAGTQSTARVIDVASGDVVWEIFHRHPPEELLSAQQDITVGVASALGLSPAGGPVQVPAFSSDEEFSAWAYVEQARELLSSAPRNQNGYQRADHDRLSVLLDEALRIAPEYAAAHAVRSMAFDQLWYQNRAQQQWIDSALVAAEHAVSLDPNHVLTQVALAGALRSANLARPERFSPELARRRFEASLRAVQLSPSDPQVVGLLGNAGRGVGGNLVWGERVRLLRRNASGLYFRRSHWYWILGDYEASLEAHERLAELGERASASAFRVPEVHLSRGDLAAARTAIEAARAQDPELRGAFPVAIYLELMEGRYASAERLIVELLERDPSIDVINTSNFHTRTALAYVYLKTGRIREGTELATALRSNTTRHVSTGAGYVAHYDLVRLNAMLGDLDAAVHWMDLAIARGWPFYYTEMGPEDPMLENVEDDPRFIGLMDGLKARLDSEREWAQEMMALPEPERFQAMLADAEEQLERMWEDSGGP